MSSTTVTPSELRKAAGEIETLLGTYNTKVNSIYGVVDSIRGIWDSEASRQFQMKMETDRPAYDSLKTFLSEYKTALLNIALKYERGEENAKVAVSNNS
jgi:WXG100 family type VII secretion target